MSKPTLAFGPMSSEAIEAVFRHSQDSGNELMLIASKNQIDHSGGYVNGWNTKQYMEFVGQMRDKYTGSNVRICRDHCGPGFNGNHDLADTYATIKSDVDNGFDLIHIDFCHYQGTRKEMLAEAKKAVLYALKLNPKIALEIGTDENTGAHFAGSELDRISDDIDFFKSFCSPEYFVVQTGSLIKEVNQVGTFNADFASAASRLLHSKGLKLKEHNADYLPAEDIKVRSGIVDAFNIAPQLGVVQTATVLQQALIQGVPFDAYLEEVYQGGKWKKWMHANSPNNKFLCSLIAGHYHFNSDNYKKLTSRLSTQGDIKETIIKSLTQIIEHYE